MSVSLPSSPVGSRMEEQTSQSPRPHQLYYNHKNEVHPSTHHQTIKTLQDSDDTFNFKAFKNPISSNSIVTAVSDADQALSNKNTFPSNTKKRSLFASIFKWRQKEQPTASQEQSFYGSSVHTTGLKYPKGKGKEKGKSPKTSFHSASILPSLHQSDHNSNSNSNHSDSKSNQNSNSHIDGKGKKTFNYASRHSHSVLISNKDVVTINSSDGEDSLDDFQTLIPSLSRPSDNNSNSKEDTTEKSDILNSNDSINDNSSDKGLADINNSNSNCNSNSNSNSKNTNDCKSSLESPYKVENKNKNVINNTKNTNNNNHKVNKNNRTSNTNKAKLKNPPQPLPYQKPQSSSSILSSASSSVSAVTTTTTNIPSKPKLPKPYSGSSHSVPSSSSSISSAVRGPPPPVPLPMTKLQEIKQRQINQRVHLEKRNILNSMNFQFEDFADITQIGKGAFAEVYLCKHVPTDEYVVVKEINRRRSGLLRHTNPASLEERILTALSANDCPFITHCYGSFKDEDNIYYVMEYYCGGELYSYIQANPCFPEYHARFYAAEVLLALFHMHDLLHIAYRDIKPENILLDKDGHICLCDFGHAKPLKKGEKTFTLCGTPDYSAPELIDASGIHDMAVDVWAFGVLVYEMLCGITPFHSPNRNELCANILACDIEYPDVIGSVAKDLISRLLVKTPSQRLGSGIKGIKEIMEHEWFENVNWENIRNKVDPPPYRPRKRDPDDASYYTLELSSENLDVFVFPKQKTKRQSSSSSS